MEKTINEIYSLEFEYPFMNEVMRILKEENLEQQNPRFELDCYLVFSSSKISTPKILKNSVICSKKNNTSRKPCKTVNYKLFKSLKTKNLVILEKEN